MAGLNDEQIAFLKSHNVPLSRVFDASGRSSQEYKAIMKELELWVAYGVTPCQAASHTLRTRAGHCVQCSPANLSYLKRFDDPGYVYVAESVRGNVIKVGTSIDAAFRVTQLNSYQYGGRTDWSLRYSEKTNKAGRAEAAAHSDLAQFSASGTYFKNDDYIECQELFSCSVEVAVAAVKRALSQIR